MPTMLIVSGRAAPQLPSRFPALHTLPDAEFLAALRQFGGTPAAVLDNAELMQAYLPLLRADFAAHETYQYREESPLEVPTFVFGGTDDPRVNRDDLDAWGTNSRSVHTFRGGHFYLADDRDAVLMRLREKTRWFVEGVLFGCRSQMLDIMLGYHDPSRLSEHELARANRFLKASDRVAFITCRVLLREFLGAHLQVPSKDVRILLGRGGKPFVESDNDLRFNVSHSHDLFAYAVATGREVGIDVEHVRNDIDHIGLAQRYFHPAEIADILALSPDGQLPGFFRVWTRKEAYVKALGLGLTIPLDGFRVSVGEPARLLSTEHDATQLGRWSVESLDVPAGYAGALCVEDMASKTLN